MCDPKEPHYFSSVTALPAWRGQAGAVTDPNTGRLVAPTVTAESAYASLFAGAGGCRVIGESSTSYLADPEACRRIRETVPDARIIIMIRDPVERAVSHHLMYVREGWETRSLEQAVDDELREGAAWAYAYLRNGRYHDDIKRYLDAFGDRVLVIVLEDFVRDVAEGMAPVWEFVGLRSGRYRRSASRQCAHGAAESRRGDRDETRPGLDGGQEAAADRDPAPGSRRNARPRRETGGRRRPPPPPGGLLRRRRGGDRAVAGAVVTVERATR